MMSVRLLLQNINTKLWERYYEQALNVNCVLKKIVLNRHAPFSSKSEPSHEFSSVFKEDFVDILEETRRHSDIKYALRKMNNIPHFKHNIARKPRDIKPYVLASERVRYAIQKTCEESKKSEKEVLAEANAILDNMMHNLNLGAVRFFAYFLVKVFRSLFRRIYMNKDGIDRLAKLITQYPVLLMPNHRSYMDFLLVSYVMYHHNLPLPVIAAAMDFQGMKFFGWLLRNCGAFYIRRSFGSDVLYWALFTEYVQTQLRNGDAPMEFFVEGTRSRTSKSYTPKIGMLSASLESYFKAEVADIMIVPITISYDRILEENLYSYELLGIPKPKESTSGLLKARSILSEDFGSVHIHLDEPISVRLFSVGHVDRTIHSLEPRYINRSTKEEQKLAKRLACHVVRRHQTHAMISPWSLMAAVIMQSPEGITSKQLSREVDWLKRLASNLSAKIDWPGDKSTEEVFLHELNLHANVLEIQDDIVKLKASKPATAGLLKEDVMTVSAGHILLSLYRNQLLHVFVRVGFVALGVNSCPQETLSLDELYERYCFLEKLLRKEFVFIDGETRQDFEQAIQTLNHSGGLALQGDQVLIRKSICKHTTFLSQMFEPFLMGYWVVCQYLLTLASDVSGRPLPKKQPALARDAQQLAVQLLQENIIKHYEILSLDIISNSLTSLADIGAIYRDKRNEQTWLSPNNVVVSNIATEIAKYIEIPNVCIANFVAGKGFGAVAKL